VRGVKIKSCACYSRQVRRPFWSTSSLLDSMTRTGVARTALQASDAFTIFLAHSHGQRAPAKWLRNACRLHLDPGRTSVWDLHWCPEVRLPTAKPEH